MGADCGDHEIRDEADKDAVVDQVEVEHDLTKLNITVGRLGSDV